LVRWSSRAHLIESGHHSRLSPHSCSMRRRARARQSSCRRTP
jgi:hypothetical protein